MSECFIGGHWVQGRDHRGLWDALILYLQLGSGTLMRYAGPLALSMTTLTRRVVSSALLADAVASLSGTPLLAKGLCAAVFAAVDLAAIAPPTDVRECSAPPAQEAPG